MQVTLDVPAGWEVTTEGFRSPDGVVILEPGPVRGPIELDPRRWLERDLPAGATVEYDEVVERARTRDGWEVTMAVMRVAPDTLWIGAIYSFPPWTGVARARVTAGHFETERERLVTCLLSARPHLWHEEPACVAELFWEHAP